MPLKILSLVIILFALCSAAKPMQPKKINAEFTARNSIGDTAKLVFGERFSWFPPQDFSIPESQVANRPWNYDDLLEFGFNEYDEGVDVERVVNRFCNQCYLWNLNNPARQVPFVETVTKFTVIANRESGGRDWASGDNGASNGTLQLKRSGRGWSRISSMRQMGLDYDNEDHRVYYCYSMVANNGYKFSPWTVTVKFRNEINRQYNELMSKD